MPVVITDSTANLFQKGHPFRIMIEQVKSRKRNWQTRYRLVLKKDETLEEVGSYRLSLVNIYVLISSLFIIAMGLTVAAIFFTPLKRLVPGFAEPTEHPEYIKLQKKVAALEGELTSYKSYYDSFRKLISNPDSSDMAPSTYQSRVNPKATGSKTGTSDAKTHQEESRVTPSVTLNPVEQTSGRLLNSADYKYLIPPISGVISNGFDQDHDHLGVDILAPKDTPVKAIWDGHVITADWTLETGYTIGIQHSNDIVSFYKHNSTILKRTGAFVRAGEAIAIVGNTGTLTTGPHLHFELWVQGKPVDPVRYIDF